MKLFAALIAVFQLAVIGAPAMAGHVGEYERVQSAAPYTGVARSVVTQRWVEEWDSVAGRWVLVTDDVVTSEVEALPSVNAAYVDDNRAPYARAAARYSKPAAARSPAPMLAKYGPFMVTSPTSAAMIGPTGSSTPRHFDAMLRDFPHLARLDMIEAPGTSNDIANLAVGRRIRAAGIATHVPSGGSVRSGAVELFLAGSQRTIEDGAEFAVHSWLDNYGREADDFAANDPAHRLYLDYYVEMGMSERRARDFYAMTNSVPHAGALWLVAEDMRFWLRPEEQAIASFAPAQAIQPAKIAYSDLTGITLAQLSLTRITLAQLDSALAFP